MANTVPYIFPPSGYAQASHVQADFDALLTLIGTGSTFATDITITSAGSGLILKTPDGLHTYRLAIDNSGNPTTEQLT